jgi:DinB superfamily
MDYWVTFQEQQTLGLIDAMPAAKYDFTPTAGSFNHVRTFGQQAKHLAAFNFMAAATMLGESIPDGTGNEVGPDSVRTKEQVIAYVRASFAALHRAAAAIDDANAVIDATAVSPLGNKATRLGVAAEALIHAMDHYGQLVEYLRMNGVIPPGST